MELQISLHGERDRTAQIYRQVLDAVVDGRLPAGSRLPASRDLAGTLGVARGTVATAYERLVAEGVLTSQVGSGTFVSDCPPAPAGSRSAARGGPRPRRIWSDLSAPLDERPARYDFRTGSADPALFPLQAWRRLILRELQADRSTDLGRIDPTGQPALRAAIAGHIGRSRSVRTSPDDLLITHGAQQAFDLIARVLVAPGDVVAIEEPGYQAVRMLLTSHGAEIRGVPVDDEGLVVAALPASARLVYVTPSHQLPLGRPMSLARRLALLEWAQKHDAVIVEDDYDSEFRHTSRPLEPLQALDRSGRVIYVGSLTKALMPTLRIGFLVAPASLQPALRTARLVTDRHGDTVVEDALAAFIDEGLLGRHLRRATKEYSRRRDAVLTGLPAPLQAVPSAAGLHVCARLPDGADSGAVVTRAAALGVGVADLATYYFDVPAPGLVLWFGGIDAEDIPEGLRRLSTVLS